MRIIALHLTDDNVAGNKVTRFIFHNQPPTYVHVHAHAHVSVGYTYNVHVASFPGSFFVYAEAGDTGVTILIFHNQPPTYVHVHVHAHVHVSVGYTYNVHVASFPGSFFVYAEAGDTARGNQPSVLLAQLNSGMLSL